MLVMYFSSFVTYRASSSVTTTHCTVVAQKTYFSYEVSVWINLVCKVSGEYGTSFWISSLMSFHIGDSLSNHSKIMCVCLGDYVRLVDTIHQTSANAWSYNSYFLNVQLLTFVGRKQTEHRDYQDHPSQFCKLSSKTWLLTPVLQRCSWASLLMFAVNCLVNPFQHGILDLGLQHRAEVVVCARAWILQSRYPMMALQCQRGTNHWS